MSIRPVFIDTATGERFPLGADIALGRAEDNDVPVAGDGISRYHAAVHREPLGHRLRDLASRNGTFVNGVRVDASGTILNDGDTVVLGGVIAFRYLDPNATPAVPKIGKLRGVWIDPANADVWVDAVKLDPPLSSRQFDLLRCLDNAGGAPVSRADIVAEVWPTADGSGVTDDAVTALVKRLRGRMREVGTGREHLEIVRGRGVRLLDPDESR